MLPARNTDVRDARNSVNQSMTASRDEARMPPVKVALAYYPVAVAAAAASVALPSGDAAPVVLLVGSESLSESVIMAARMANADTRAM